jgi:hypothetical protein
MRTGATRSTWLPIMLPMNGGCSEPSSAALVAPSGKGADNFVERHRQIRPGLVSL